MNVTWFLRDSLQMSRSVLRHCLLLAVVTMCLLSGSALAGGDLRIRGSYVGRVEDDGTIRIRGTAVGRFEKDGGIRIKGTLVGKIESDGTIRKRGSSIARIESDGDVRVNGSLQGKIEDDGDVRKRGTLIGSARGVKPAHAAALFFCGFIDLGLD